MTHVHRIEVRPREGASDPKGAAACREARSLGLPTSPSQIDAAGVYLIEGALTPVQVLQIATELLADPVMEQAIIGAAPPRADALIEVHPLPGVMDPDADAVRLAIESMLGTAVQVRTGRRYDLHGTDAATARSIVERTLANSVIHAIHEQPYHPEKFLEGTPYELKIVTVPIRDLDDAGLERLSREGHLFLSLEEMRAIQEEYRTLGREPREIELETLAQTWSEHCVHKTLKATIRYRENIDDASQSPRIAMHGRPGHETHDDGSVTIHNLLKSTVAAATHELIAEGIDWCLSVFVDNAGIIVFDDQYAVCFKCETHNHPSAIEPYGGAATGIGGCIRDIIGTGLAARPIAATDVFCVAYPDHWAVAAETSKHPPSASDEQNHRGARGERGEEINDSSTTPSPLPSSASSAISAVTLPAVSLPAGVLHPRRVLQQIVAGVRDYGNRMGIPTLNGAVWFHDDYIGNPLVYCGCIGVMPRDMISGEAKPGDRIIAVGGRTGRDGIHGATFSSAELTDTHADEFSHAVQIGNPVTEKKMLDAIIEARDTPGPDGRCLYSGITDCGAGGFSSAVGEMGEKLGAQVHLERAPLKYIGLSPTEVWISEAQERMVLAVPPHNVDALAAICDKHDVEMCDLGHFGMDDCDLILLYEGTEVGRMPMEFLHEGIPQTVREAVFEPESSKRRNVETSKERKPSIGDALLQLLRHPNIASKHWIIQQYDHEVQGNSVVKPLVGVRGDGPSDAAVVLPVEGSTRGLAIGNGLATGLSDDPYVMTLAAIDECVRNMVCTGADPDRIAILDNFCWPSCKRPENLGSLVRAAEACYDGAKAYRTPFISGKDSLNNQFTTDDGRTIQIPPTLLISGMGIVHDVRKCVTMDAKRAGNVLVLVGTTHDTLSGSHFEMLFGREDGSLPAVDLDQGPAIARAVYRAIEEGCVCAAHDCSDGGMLVAAAEMALAGDLGLTLELANMPCDGDAAVRAFGESPSRYLLEVEVRHLEALRRVMGDLSHAVVGEFNDTARLHVDGADIAIADLRSAWRSPLDW